ncbi:hypothetical protein FXO38_28894 [Capsicum annuum]|uniref:Uncharacterized protein n=1 Tax=Capsicum annuum TaxID=4072 RepID=A0A2G2Y8D1_CAPAN|nr:hypothetical protein FXO38_28894 [Capsicum annuum]KAF3635695.1 hypothetical protein FXO37_25854 [Capsicum annuum]PHT65811.1 hypothetical protein T459_30236 [Capsicum annuum]
MVPSDCTKFLNITLACCGSIEQYSFLILNFDPTVNCARYCNGFPDMEQLNVVKEALHMSRAPSNLLCREIENNRILEFCKQFVNKRRKEVWIYVAAKGQESLCQWRRLTKSWLIWKKSLASRLQTFCPSTVILCQTHLTFLARLIFADELDYLFAKDKVVLHKLFMLTTLPFSRFILIGYCKSETVDPSMKMENILSGSEGSAEISQTRSPLKERKSNESVDLRPSTMSTKIFILEEQSVESYENCYR